MAGPVLVPCLVALRQEFDDLAPHRDKGADGWIGDPRHQAEVSDHNPDDTPGVRTPYTDPDHTPEVHAIDIDRDLGSGLELTLYVERIRVAHLMGADDRLQNIIWRGRIASRNWGWGWRSYSGPSKHFDHAHFSARYGTAQERDTRPWGVYDAEDTMNQADFNALMGAWADAQLNTRLTTWANTADGQAAIGAAVLSRQLGKSTVTVAAALQNTELASRVLPGLADAVRQDPPIVKP